MTGGAVAPHSDPITRFEHNSPIKTLNLSIIEKTSVIKTGLKPSNKVI